MLTAPSLGLQCSRLRSTDSTFLDLVRQYSAAAPAAAPAMKMAASFLECSISARFHAIARTDYFQQAGLTVVEVVKAEDESNVCEVRPSLSFHDVQQVNIHRMMAGLQVSSMWRDEGAREGSLLCHLLNKPRCGISIKPVADTLRKKVSSISCGTRLVSSGKVWSPMVQS